ncbi:glycoside hydrolase superfamily [Aspergillus varians]
MMLRHATLALAALQCVAGLRFAMYIDEYHTENLPGSDKTQGITHAIMGFAKSTDFNGDSPPAFQPFEPVSTMRNRFADDTKVLIAIGGWGDTAGFSKGAKDEASRKQYAKNVAAMLDSSGFDGVDIDWEYPGGNGEDYKKVPNEEKVSEIETFPLFLQALREAVGDEKIISIATPGKRGDMIAYTAEQGPKIWPSVDMINVMSYDLMNRRNNETKHHTGVVDSLDSVKAYLEIGAPPEKINLGFAYYMKWFTTEENGDCDSDPIGCPTVAMEEKDGSDNGKSGAITFETKSMAPPPANLRVSTDMTCGLEKGAKCPAGSCCSIYGNCGTTDDFCVANCDSNYGECKGAPVQSSLQLALKDGKTDEEGGGQYYMDTENNLFWTWDTPALMTRKFTEIVDAENLGGVMAWSLGEDTYKWEHLKAMQEGVAQRAGGDTASRRGCTGPFSFTSRLQRLHLQRLPPPSSVAVKLAANMKPITLFTFVPLSLSLTIPIDHSTPHDSSQSSLQQQPLLESPKTEPELEPVPSLEINHGSFIYADKPRTQSSASSNYTHALHTEQSPYILLERYSDELFAAGLLLLVPITLGIVELADCLARSLSVEEFPDRGRDKHRIESLKEREEWVLRRKEREIKIEESRSWWKWSRH